MQNNLHIYNSSHWEPTLFRYEYDDHYFLTDPKEFIYEFFPLQPEWQLLKEPITLEEFEELPFVRSLFFRYQLAFPTEHMKSVMTTDQTGENDKNDKNKDNYNHRMRLISEFFFKYHWTFFLCLRCLHCSVRNAAWYAVSADISLQPQVLQQWHWQLWWSFTQTIRHAGKRYNSYRVSQK